MTDGAPAPEVVHISGPLDEAVARGLRAGQVVSVDGTIWGVRDATLIHMFDRGELPAVDLTGSILLHTAPGVRPRTGGGYEPVSIGTTTSMRMDRFTAGCLQTLGARAIVGKGGLSRESDALLAEHGAVYLAIVGGAASTETLQIEEIEDVIFEDLMPECLWKFRVRDFGPLFVATDTTGASLYEETREQVERRRSRAEQILGISS